MLGTGSSDGWPNPWCAKPCCTSLVEAGIVRTQTSALIDRVLLVDPGAEERAQIHELVQHQGATDGGEHRLERHDQRRVACRRR